jgi:hypothetical protein
LLGGTHLGKSDFAAGLGAHINFHGDTDLETMMKMDITKLEYAIFDDVDWKKTCLSHENWKHWMGCQYSFTSFDRYTHKVSISPWGKPSIFLVNRHPWCKEGLDYHQWAWALGNADFVDIGQWDPLRLNAISSADIHERGNAFAADYNFIAIQ